MNVHARGFFSEGLFPSRQMTQFCAGPGLLVVGTLGNMHQHPYLLEDRPVGFDSFALILQSPFSCRILSAPAAWGFWGGWCSPPLLVMPSCQWLTLSGCPCKLPACFNTSAPSLQQAGFWRPEAFTNHKAPPASSP